MEKRLRDKENQGIFLQVAESFMRVLGEMWKSEPETESDESKESPTLKEYVKNNPEAEDLLEKPKAEGILEKGKASARTQVVKKVEIKQSQAVKNPIIQQQVKGDEEQQL